MWKAFGQLVQRLLAHGALGISLSYRAIALPKYRVTRSLSLLALYALECLLNKLTVFSSLKAPLAMLQPEQTTELVDRGGNSLGEIPVLVEHVE